MKRIVTITANNNDVSMETRDILTKKLEQEGFTVYTELNPDTELIICVGGDGAMLRTFRSFDFPEIPVIGINTGHLGFFPEIMPDDLDAFIEAFENGNFIIQKMKVLQAVVKSECGESYLYGINEITIKANQSRPVHLNLSLGSNFVERFSGDGILVATPAGSTAYNYALGGCLVDPRLDLLQVTPISPMNSTAYRSFTSSVVVPPDICINIVPELSYGQSILMAADGHEFQFDDVKEIYLSFSNKVVQLMRLEDYDFWSKVKTKFL